MKRSQNQQDKHRYQLLTEADCLCYVRTFVEAEQRAVKLAAFYHETVRIFDRQAHRNKINLWEVRPNDTFIRAIRVKRVRVPVYLSRGHHVRA